VQYLVVALLEYVGFKVLARGGEPQEAGFVPVMKSFCCFCSFYGFKVVLVEFFEAFVRIMGEYGFWVHRSYSVSIVSWFLKFLLL